MSAGYSRKIVIMRVKWNLRCHRFDDVSRTVSNRRARIEHVMCNDLVPTPKLDVDSYCKAGRAEERYMSNRH